MPTIKMVTLIINSDNHVRDKPTKTKKIKVKIRKVAEVWGAQI